MPRDTRISEDPGKYFSASGNATEIKIWILFSERDPNPRPNDGNCFGVELYNKTSSTIKFGTSGTRRMPRVLICHWRTINSSENGEKWRFSDPRDPNFAVRQLWHLRMRKIKTRGKLGYPSENLTFQDGTQLPPDLDNLDLTWWIPNWEIPSRKNSSNICDGRTMQKAYLPMHYPCTAVHGNFRNFTSFPNSCLGTDLIPVWKHDADWP